MQILVLPSDARFHFSILPSHPAEVHLEDVIKPLGFTATKGVKDLGLSRKLSEPVNQRASLKPEMALRGDDTGEQYFASSTVEHIHEIIKSRKKPDKVVEAPVYEYT